MTLNLVECRLWKGGTFTKPVPLGQTQPVPVGQADWDSLCLSHLPMDMCACPVLVPLASRHVVLVPVGQTRCLYQILSHWDWERSKLERDLSLSRGQVIYPRWRPVLVAGPWQALCPRWNLSQSNLSHPVPQSRTTRPWKVLARAHCPSHIISDQVEMEKLTRINNKTSTEWSCAEDQILGNKNLRNRILNICTERYVKYFFEIYLPVREHTWLIGSGGLEKDGYWLMLLLLLRKK